MKCKVALVGLPNAGKSTLFQALTNQQVLVANYPFATINPNIANVLVPDQHVDRLHTLFPTSQKIYSSIMLYDIAGLIKGASAGEGLGNKFLAQIRTTNVICCLIRCFENKNVSHVNDKLDPVNDIETLFIELINADQTALASFLPKLQKQLKKTADKKLLTLYNRLVAYQAVLALNDVKAWQLFLQKNDNLQDVKLIDLLTTKPLLLCGNINENDLKATNTYAQTLRQYAHDHHFAVTFVCADLLYQLSQLSVAEAEFLLSELELKTNDAETLVKQVYQMLGLKTFYTAGDKEVRAWSFPTHATAQQCAGIIHSDFAANFVKAEVYSLSDLWKYKTNKNLQQHGKIKLVGKEQEIYDEDVVFFIVRK